MIWDFIKNMIPWWVYLGLGLAAVAALWVFFGPIILAVWHRLPNWLQWTIALIAAVALAVVYGRNKGYGDAKAMQERLNARAVQKRAEIHNEIRQLDEPAVDKRLDKWMRD